MNLSNQRNNQNNDLNLNIYAPYKGFISANRLSSEKNKNRILILNEERKDNIVLFNTFSSKPKIEENKSQKIQNVHIKNKEEQKSQKIKKAKSVNYNKIKYYDNEEDKKRDSLNQNIVVKVMDIILIKEGFLQKGMKSKKHMNMKI